MEISSAIARLRDIGRPILQSATAQEEFPVRFTFRLVLERIDASLNTLEVLIKSDLLRHDHAIGLICRNIMSDVIATGYLIKMPLSEEDQYKHLYALYYADLNRMDKVVELFHEAKVLSAKDVEKYKEKHAMPNSISKGIRDYVEKYKPGNFLGNTAIIKALLKAKKEDSWSIEIQRSFDVWVYYSKYEHIGWYAYELTRDLDLAKATSRLRLVLRLTALMQGSCFEKLEEKIALEESMVIYRELLITPTYDPVASE